MVQQLSLQMEKLRTSELKGLYHTASKGWSQTSAPTPGSFHYTTLRLCDGQDPGTGSTQAWGFESGSTISQLRDTIQVTEPF